MRLQSTTCATMILCRVIIFETLHHQIKGSEVRVQIIAHIVPVVHCQFCIKEVSKRSVPASGPTPLSIMYPSDSYIFVCRDGNLVCVGDVHNTQNASIIHNAIKPLCMCGREE